MADCVLVTGGSRNIGRGICERLSDEGHVVVQFDVLEPENPNVAEFVKVDLSNEEETAAALKALSSRHRVTRLVNNVGISCMANIEDTDLTEFDRVLRINTRVAMQCAQAVVPGMKAARFGRIVNIASRAIVGIPGLSAYAASKAAVVGLMKTWAMELAPAGITSNAVAPGPIDTDMLREAYSTELYEKTRASVPVGRFGQPADIANAVAFLIDDRSALVNGQVLHCCGGMSIGRAG
ncbi:MAG: SDR family NAD(P)-dependent oxidoreductase [Alphaproteobacteria bacterium]|nr:SDR family NAD(P)-dependent oxidoreductase [Alphaproteobacteria bacterium]